MVKKLLVTFLCISLVASLSITSFAEDTFESVKVITDKEELKEFDVNKPRPDAELAEVRVVKFKDIKENILENRAHYKTFTKIRNIQTFHYRDTKLSSRIDRTDGHAGSTLWLDVSKSVSTQLSTTMNFSNKNSILSGALGFNVTKSYTVTNKNSYLVPNNKKGGVMEAYPTMMEKTFDIYQKDIPIRGDGYKKRGTGFATKAVGVYFKVWTY